MIFCYKIVFTYGSQRPSFSTRREVLSEGPEGSPWSTGCINLTHLKSSYSGSHGKIRTSSAEGFNRIGRIVGFSIPGIAVRRSCMDKNLDRSSSVLRVGGLKATVPSRFLRRASAGVNQTPSVVSLASGVASWLGIVRATKKRVSNRTFLASGVIQWA